MEASVVLKGDDLSDVNVHRGKGINSAKSRDELFVLTQRFRIALEKGVAGIIEAG